MAGFKELEDQIRLVSQTDIGEVIFARIEDINSKNKNSYPLILFTPISSTGLEARKKNNKEVFSIDFFIADLDAQGDTESRSEKWDRLNKLLKQILQKIDSSEIKLMNDTIATYGYDEHNDRLVVVKRTASIEIFDCLT